jgi:hypothetical protein
MPLTFAGVGTRDAALVLFYAPYSALRPQPLSGCYAPPATSASDRRAALVGQYLMRLVVEAFLRKQIAASWPVVTKP